MKMEWSKLLSEETLSSRTKGAKLLDNQNESPFEEDYRRIVLSSAFRRLQDKTQVFPLDKSDFVRTRLTHSIETSSVAKQLGAFIFQYSSERTKQAEMTLGEEKHRISEIQNVLSCAGLLHDLGNPPFGHFGEELVGQWFRTKFNDETWVFNGKTIASRLDGQMRSDLENFNGNAQNIRLIAKACRPDTGASNDLNLSYATVQTLIKYPRSSTEAVPKDKFGYFFSEEDLVKKIAATTETIENGTILRHPLTSLLEVADDIAYATADLEDAFKKGAFTLTEFIAFYEKEISDLSEERGIAKAKMREDPINLIEELKNLLTKENRTREEELIAFNSFVKYARHWLVHTAGFSFLANYIKIMEGSYKQDLHIGTFHELSIQAFKNAMKVFVYDSEMIIRPELSAQTIIFFLLDRLVPAAISFDADEGGKRILAVDKKASYLIPENLKEDYCKTKKEGAENYNLYLRLLMVTDFISGMTDSYAKNLYQDLSCAGGF